jgi:hypothetical protein
MQYCILDIPCKKLYPVQNSKVGNRLHVLRVGNALRVGEGKHYGKNVVVWFQQYSPELAQP